MTDKHAPYYAIHAFFCVNARPPEHPKGSCADRGSVELCLYMKEQAKKSAPKQGRGVRIQQTGCLGRCASGPVFVIYPDGVWYAPRTKDDVDEILLSHLEHGKPVARLLIPFDAKPRIELEAQS